MNPKNEVQVVTGGESEGIGRTPHLSKLFCLFVLATLDISSHLSCKSMA